MTLEQWIALQDRLTQAVSGISFTEKEEKRILRFFSAMVRDKSKHGGK